MQVIWNDTAQAIEIKFENPNDHASILGINATGQLEKRVISNPPSLSWDSNPPPNGLPPISPSGTPFPIPPPANIPGSSFLKPSFLLNPNDPNSKVYYSAIFMQLNSNPPTDQGTVYNFTFIADRRELNGDDGSTNITILGEDTAGSGPQGCLKLILDFLNAISGRKN
jgi:hypothetical protein